MGTPADSCCCRLFCACHLTGRGGALHRLPLIDAKTYRLFVLRLNANGGDGCKALATVSDERCLEIGLLDADVFFYYLGILPKDATMALPKPE